MTLLPEPKPRNRRATSPAPPVNTGPMKPPGKNIPAPAPMTPKPIPVGRKPQEDINAKAAKQLAKGGGVVAAQARRAASGLSPLGNRVVAQMKKLSGASAPVMPGAMVKGPGPVRPKGDIRKMPPGKPWDEGPMGPGRRGGAKKLPIKTR